MDFIANGVNGKYLSNVLPSKKTEVDGVYAAIAYGSPIKHEYNDLIGNCIQNKLRLDIWMRYDHTVPVAIPVLRQLLDNHQNNIFCKLVPDRFHSKVIWWKGYGAYIGSANLTDRAWMNNVEAGIFLSEGDLQADGMALQLESFFDRLTGLDVAFELSEEVIQELTEIEELRAPNNDTGKDKRKTPEWRGLSFVQDKKKSPERRKENFRQEWQSTLTTLRSIGEQLADAKPSWVSEDVPINWQVDQFLHAYYYNKVSDGGSRPFEEFYQRHHSDPQKALQEAVNWWVGTLTPPSHEDRTLDEQAPFIREELQKDKILHLDENKFSTICSYTHATRDHISKISLAVLGKPELQSLSLEERIPLFANWLWNKKNNKGLGVRGLLNFVLYEGEDSSLWERLYLAGRTEAYRLPHYGLNSLAELVGWARPEIAPPRNGRTSKALRALGYDVKVY